MPTDTPALLPPDPSVPGRYWVRASDGRNVIATWSPKGFWRVAGRTQINTPKYLTHHGYTLASRYPIPGPAALKAVYQVVETLLDVANLSVITPQDEIHVGPVIYAASGAQVKALRDAAAMLRAALETKETT